MSNQILVRLLVGIEFVFMIFMIYQTFKWYSDRINIRMIVTVAGIAMLLIVNSLGICFSPFMSLDGPGWIIFPGLPTLFLIIIRNYAKEDDEKRRTAIIEIRAAISHMKQESGSHTLQLSKKKRVLLARIRLADAFKNGWRGFYNDGSFNLRDIKELREFEDLNPKICGFIGVVNARTSRHIFSEMKPFT